MIEQLEYLRQQGCDEVQGYYLSKSLPAVITSLRLPLTCLQSTPGRQDHWLR